jgi:hypothetical protein
VNYDDQQLLLKWARLMLDIAIAKCPADRMNMSHENITHSIGYRRLRAWFTHLSPRAKIGARRWMRAQIDGVRELLAKAKATGERIEMGEIVIETFDDTGTAVQAPDISKACRGSGGGLTGVQTNASGWRFVKCSACAATWHADDVPFHIPTHEPKIEESADGAT